MPVPSSSLFVALAAANRFFIVREVVMRVGLISLITIVGCAAAVGAAQKSTDDKTAPSMEAQKAPNEALLTRPIVPLAELIDQIPDGGQVIGLYQASRTVRDVEVANENVKAQVTKAQSIASDVARLHAAAIKSCEGAETSQIEAIAIKARSLSATLVRVDGELTKSLAAMRQKVETEKPGSTRAKEDVNRFVLATHELGRLRVQAQEIAKSVESLGGSISATSVSCVPTPVPPLFAEPDAPAKVGAPASRSPSLSPRRGTKPTTTTSVPRFPW
jgi:hypothetical protein